MKRPEHASETEHPERCVVYAALRAGCRVSRRDVHMEVHPWYYQVVHALDKVLGRAVDDCHFA